MKDNNARVFGIVSIVAALLSIVGKLITVMFFTDKATGVYSKASAFPQIFGYIVAAFCIGLAIWGFISKNDFSRRESPVSTTFTTFTTAVFGFIMLAYTAILLFSNVAGRDFSTTEIILTITSFLSGIYYLAVIFSRKSNRNLFATLSMIPIIWSTTALIELYFDMSVLISSPSRIWVQLAYLSLMVFLLAEARFNVEHPSTLLYAPSAAIATVFLLSTSIPNLIFIKSTVIGTTERPITYAVMLAAGLYSLSRLISFCFISEVEEDEDTNE